MVRIPSFTRRSETTAASEDENRDGRINERDERPARGSAAVREQVDDRDGSGGRSTSEMATEAPADVRTRRAAADRAAADRASAEREADRAEANRLAATRERDDAVTEQLDRDRTAEAPAGPRPRASLMATLGLIVGVTAALTVLTGVLAGYGVALGLVGLFLSIFGVSATSKRHVAGKSDALLGAAFSIGAMVIGALALTGSLDWLTSESNKVDQLKQWLDTNLANRF